MNRNAMKDRNVKQVMQRGGHQWEGEGKGGRTWSMYFLHMYEYGTLKSSM
jgi:hypothetical protein